MAADQLTTRAILAGSLAAPAQREPKWRWIDRRAVSGEAVEAREPDSSHMDVDAALLQEIADGCSPATIRCYTWANPCVTYGRLQDINAVQAAYPDFVLIRRPTGGRAVLHSDDLTISVCAGHDFVRRWSGARDASLGVHATYLSLVAPIREALAAFGVATEMGGSDSRAGARSGNSIEDADCFSSAGRCDVVAADTGEKLLGSAMRRTSEAVLLQVSLRQQRDFDVRGNQFVRELRFRYRMR